MPISDDSDDEDLAIRMMCGDEDALREVLKRHLEPVRELLAGIYGTTVQQANINEAMNQAIYNLWHKAGKYDKGVATIDAWFFTIAQNALLDIYQREKRHRTKHPLIPEDYDVAEECEPEEPLTKEDTKELKDLDHVIEHKLKGHQKAIIKADLAVGGTADAGSLAEMLNTTKESIYVSRHKAHENIRKEMTQLAQSRERLRGKK